jgi:hypothetical protein
MPENTVSMLFACSPCLVVLPGWLVKGRARFVDEAVPMSISTPDDSPADPDRHPAVPAAATWRADLEKWELVTRDSAGARQGECRLFRSDGSLYLRTHYAGDFEDGAFTFFHPSGEVARQGQRLRGELDGDLVARIAMEGEGEPLRSCCVPGPAVEMRSRFEAGSLVFERFYDGEGRLLLSDGRLCPERPAPLAERAEYDEGSGLWMVPPLVGAEDRLSRFYDQGGALVEESLIEEGWKTFTRLYAGDGSVKAEVRSTRDGRKQGAFFRRFVDGDANPYLDARIAEERGAYTADRPCGRWTFHDATGAVVRTVVHEPEARAAPASEEMFADDVRPPEAWLALAEALVAAGETGRAACAAARAAARVGTPDAVIGFLAAHTVALAPVHAEALSRQAVEKAGDSYPPPGSDPQTLLLSALVAGGEPSELFRALSGLHRSAPRAALDLAEATLLLAPDGAAGFLTRALARLEVGDDRGALADAKRLEGVSAETAQFLRSFCAVLYPTWDFWPAEEDWGPPVEGVPDEPGQPLDAIVRVMQVYATRLLRLREAVLQRLPHRDRASWLPPALSALLPDGPVALRRWETTITDQTDDGPETVAVTIDETMDSEGAQISTLMRRARANWAALTWLSWAVGLREVALPTTVAPPSTFSAGAVAGITRYFRVEDTLATGGLRSRTQDVPSFAWHGTDIDDLPRPLVEVALQEARELRALFLWLLSPENHSPLQSDLRAVD